MTPEQKSKYEEFAKVYNDLDLYPDISAVSKKLGMAARTIRSWASTLRRLRDEDETLPTIIDRSGKAALVKPLGAAYRTIETELPSYEEPIEDLLKRVITTNERYDAYRSAKGCVDVKIQFPGPYGVVGLPDNHLNNIGTSAKQAFRDAATIARHPHLFAVGIGDWLDNFIVGFLERERRKDVMSHSDAWRLLEHYLDLVAPKLVAAISGNHMDWSTSAGGVDLMKKQFEQYGIG